MKQIMVTLIPTKPTQRLSWQHIGGEMPRGSWGWAAVPSPRQPSTAPPHAPYMAFSSYLYSSSSPCSMGWVLLWYPWQIRDQRTCGWPTAHTEAGNAKIYYELRSFHKHLVKYKEVSVTKWQQECARLEQVIWEALSKTQYYALFNSHMTMK